MVNDVPIMAAALISVLFIVSPSLFGSFYPCAAAFIAAVKPRLLLLVETEIWPATLYAAARAGVPVFIVNARLSPSTAGLYRALAPLARLAFSGVRRVLAQTEADAARYDALSGLAGKVTVTGNLKHDMLGISAAGQDKVKDFILASGWGGAPAQPGYGQPVAPGPDASSSSRRRRTRPLPCGHSQTADRRFPRQSR